MRLASAKKNTCNIRTYWLSRRLLRLTLQNLYMVANSNRNWNRVQHISITFRRRQHGKVELRPCNTTHHINKRSISSLTLRTSCIIGEPSWVNIEQAMTARETPHARPSDTFEATNTYGTSLSSHSNGR